ncbi:MAG TPA: site-2 protease family protein, partial [Cryptosporangiaceae bacterium]|nr:site-2 protease family protein [Cryptosporangiaceae bacterium]
MVAERAEEQGARRGLRIGRILGVPVYVSAAWLVMAVLLIAIYAPVVQGRLAGISVSRAYLVAAAFVGLLLASVLAHELGHAVTAKRLGIRVRAMTLWMLGGYTELEREPSTPAGEFLVAVAGPAVSLALGAAGIAAAVVTPAGGTAHELAVQFALSNVLVGVFNLLPGLPLDGGSLVRAGLWRLTGDRHGATIASGWTGRAVAVLVLAGGVALSTTRSSTGVLLTIVVGLFLWMGASRAIRAGRLAR